MIYALRKLLNDGIMIRYVKCHINTGEICGYAWHCRRVLQQKKIQDLLMITEIAKGEKGGAETEGKD